MEYMYLLIFGSDWDDTKIYISKEDAINASIKHPKQRVEIFDKAKTSGYRPTYNYYKNGEYIQGGLSTNNN